MENNEQAWGKLLKYYRQKKKQKQDRSVQPCNVSFRIVSVCIVFICIVSFCIVSFCIASFYNIVSFCIANKPQQP